MTTLWLTQELTGSILDVGGGGEGIIGRRYGSRSSTTVRRSWTKPPVPAESCGWTLRPFPLRGLLLRTSPSFTP